MSRPSKDPAHQNATKPRNTKLIMKTDSQHNCCTARQTLSAKIPNECASATTKTGGSNNNSRTRRSSAKCTAWRKQEESGTSTVRRSEETIYAETTKRSTTITTTTSRNSTKNYRQGTTKESVATNNQTVSQPTSQTDRHKASLRISACSQPNTVANKNRHYNNKSVSIKQQKKISGWQDGK